MYVKIHKAQHGDVVAVCDEELIGKTIKDKKHTVTISEQFYKGERMKEQAVIMILKDAKNINLIGKKTIALGLKIGVITRENVVMIAGVPHAQAVA